MLKLFLGFSLIGLFVAFDLNLCDTKKTIQCELWETCCPGKGGTYGVTQMRYWGLLGLVAWLLFGQLNGGQRRRGPVGGLNEFQLKFGKMSAEKKQKAHQELISAAKLNHDTVVANIAKYRSPVFVKDNKQMKLKNTAAEKDQYEYGPGSIVDQQMRDYAFIQAPLDEKTALDLWKTVWQNGRFVVKCKKKGGEGKKGFTIYELTVVGPPDEDKKGEEKGGGADTEERPVTLLHFEKWAPEKRMDGENVFHLVIELHNRTQQAKLAHPHGAQYVVFFKLRKRAATHQQENCYRSLPGPTSRPELPAIHLKTYIGATPA
ncbi:unnamed protein product, partial [Mesorhabditis spiculigera]